MERIVKGGNRMLLKMAGVWTTPLKPLAIRGWQASLIFTFLDLLWFNILPLLNLSYGPALVPWLFFLLFRSAMLFVWLLCMQWMAQRKAKLVSGVWLGLLLLPNLLLLGFGIYSFGIEPFNLTVTRIQVAAPGVARRLRIVQLSDLHIEGITSRERRLPDLVESLHPDLIVLTGDYANVEDPIDPQVVGDVRDVVGRLHAPLGVYAVIGNVDRLLFVQKAFAGLDVHFLDNEVVRIPQAGERFALLGLKYSSDLNGRNTLSRLMRQVPSNDFTVLLYHTPDLAYAARDAQVNLYLAGHTHGGQVRLPFYGALVTLSKYGKTFEAGLYQVGSTTLYVNRGIGMSGDFAPRLRFLCPPEVLSIDLVPEESSDGH